MYMELIWYGAFSNQGKVNLEVKALERGVCKEVKAVHKEEVSTSTTPCWAFATFDGHAGSACAQFLKENFMVRELI